MEIQISCPIIFSFIFFLLLIRKLSNSRKSSKPLPPGPPKLPLIGNLHQLVGSLPHRRLRDLANKYGPLMHLQLGETSNVVITSPEIVKEITKTHDQVFSNRPKILVSEIFAYNSTDLVFAPYGSYWRLLRKVCTLELLSMKRVQSFKKIREEEVSEVVKFIDERQGSAVNLSKIISPVTNSIVGRAAFGKKTKNVEKILSTVAYTVQVASGFTISDLYPSLKFLNALSVTRYKVAKAHREVDRLLGNIIDDHRGNKEIDVDGDEAHEDLVDVLLRVQKQNNDEVTLTLDNIKAVILDVFVGGTETSASTLEWAMSELMNHPAAMEKAQAEVRRVYGSKGYVDESELHQLKYVPAVIRETLRLHPPGSLLVPRENSETVEINGYEISRKTRVMINAWAIGRDPKYWNEADKFEPKRFVDSSIDYKGGNLEFIPFGFGRRICPGISFAAPVLQLILSNLLYHFDWKLPNGTNELDMTEEFGATVRRKNDLCVVPIRYSH
ncbi:cytochrome P450 71D10-like [Prosopis cineraria]|uniref:cytochrome P450 71D10-like n=1 Tax=Prosopis cineraria TaxID=364024 RepID=UPI00240FDBB6|nr:cytochrome P450 71D10-like [Prosopis cineraria]